MLRCEALNSATALPGNSRLLTSQSSAFFREPGTPRAYSGEQISRPAAHPPPQLEHAGWRSLAIEVRIEMGQAREAAVELHLDILRRQLPGRLQQRGI